MAAFDAWLTRGSLGVKVLERWSQPLRDELVTVDVEGSPMLVAAEHADELQAQAPSDVVCLLPGFDQYVLAAGTAAAEVVPPERRREVSRTAGWIAPVVISGGRVAGVWEVKGGTINVALFENVPRAALAKAIARMETLPTALAPQVEPDFGDADGRGGATTAAPP
jgi:hypothetical protein